ncbi:MAG: hypothetical protein ACOX2F_07095 [bacterium]
MNKIILLLSVFMIFVFFTGCKAPGCTELSWSEAYQVEDNGIEYKYSAGKKCGNIRDYWDIDIEKLISTIQKMKFVLKKPRCHQKSEDEIVEVECPDFFSEVLPEVIEFGKLTSCSFGTPREPNQDCLPGPMVLSFHTDTFFDSVSWGFFTTNNHVSIKSKNLDIYAVASFS